MKKETKPVVKKAAAKKPATKKTKKVPAYIQRMVEEQKDLLKKISKASEAIEKGIVKNPVSVQLLSLQVMAMGLYEDVLGRRIINETFKAAEPKCNCCKDKK